MNDPKSQMDHVRMIVRENQTRRLYLLHELYRWGDGHPCEVSIEFLTEPVWKEFDILDVAGYLEEEGLLVIGVDKEQGRGPVPNLRLTHKGITEVEKSIEHPSEATDHFPAPLVQNFHAPVGSVQVGAKSIARATQNLRKGREG